MTHPINIYAISRIHHSTSAFSIVEKHEAQKEAISKSKDYEINSLRIFVHNLITHKMGISFFDGFFYSYKIPQIGKEFDLLKFSEEFCVNIELKSEKVPNEQILDQLKRNKYYLKNISKKLSLYTVITDTMLCYTLSSNDELIKVDFEEIVSSLNEIKTTFLSEIDCFFKPSEYLVSPLNTPDKFIQDEYFLTLQQEHIKKQLIDSIDDLQNSAYFHLTGKPGTGKTLLLYDIAKTLSKRGKTIVIHCGILSPGQARIKAKIQNLNVVSAKALDLKSFDLNKYSYLLVDESHRIYINQFEKICNSVTENNKICIFSSDPEQILSQAEKRNEIVAKIEALPNIHMFKLSEKIRTNKELNSFIMRMRNLKRKPNTPVRYSNVHLNYANTQKEAAILLQYYRDMDYVFINYSKSNYQMSPYSLFDEDYDTHHVIGQEFDKVVMLLDDSFYYDENGLLQGKSHPNPNYLYPNLLYQGITRVRESLSIIVLKAQDLFEKIVGIVEG